MIPDGQDLELWFNVTPITDGCVCRHRSWVCSCGRFDVNVIGFDYLLSFGGKMLVRIIRKYKIGVIAMLPLFLFAIPHSVAAQAGKAAEGQKLFEARCVQCHGPDGSANTTIGKAVGAKDLRAAEALKLTDAEITTQIEREKITCLRLAMPSIRIKSVIWSPMFAC